MTDAPEPNRNDADPRSTTASGEPGTPRRPTSQRTTVIARTVVRVTVPIILVTSIALLLQGHNRPGGGFIGGVLTATAVVLVYVVFGQQFLESDLLDVPSESARPRPAIDRYRLVVGLGLGLAFASGLTPLLADAPFLTQGVRFFEHVPLYGEVEVASAFAFDLGVYLAIVGSLLTVVGEVGGE